MNPLAFGMPSSGRAERHRHPWARRIAVVTGFILVPSLLTPLVTPASAAADPLGRPDLKDPKPAKVSPWTVKTNQKNADIVAKSAAADRKAAERARKDQSTTVTWPIGGAATLSMPGKGTAKAEPGKLPVTLAAPKPDKSKKQIKTADAVKVNVLDQKAATKLGVKGVALTVTGPAGGGKAQVGLDYSAFASAYGGDWAGRLQVLELPDCALKDPDKAKCRTRTPLEFTNHRSSQQLQTPLTFDADTNSASAKNSAPAAGETKVLALAAGDKSAAGSYKATPLASSSTWEAGGSSGTFTWSYPLRTPPAAAGPQPDLSISYNSGSVDGRTGNTNNQGTSLGEGFDITSSYIERKYGSCDDDDQADKFDLCWKYDNASLVLNGKATELVKDDTSGEWHLKNDDESTVKHHTGADNGDDGATDIDGKGEYWTVTTGDGTSYTFGLHKLPGAGTDERTKSTWTVPVFGDDEGEPGYKDGTTFSGRDKKQAWRWNLDLVEDTHNNAMTYWYEDETNNYDTLGNESTGTSYTRGGYLKEIRYGQKSGSLFSASPAASNKVTFTYAERCIAAGTGCDALTEDKRDNWPDVPFDVVCKDGDKCTGNTAPSFFTRKRMTGITTHAWNAASTATDKFEPVDNWTFKQLYLDPGDTGDSHDQSLWLDEIKHTGKRGTDLALDPVKFTHEFKPNRVDGTTDDILSLEKPRLKTVTSETGAQTIVTYMDADCIYGQTMPKVDDNTRRCYPVFWSPNGEKTPILDWFQKYPVASVSATDPRGGSQAVQHTYQYSGGGAWHYNEDPFTPAKERTWSSWRGYEKVTHLTGGSGTQQKTVTLYLRGMNGDRVLSADGKLPDKDKRKSVTMTGITAPAIDDHDRYAGFTRETVTYNGADEVSGTVNSVTSKKTATQHKSYADIEAYRVRVGAEHDRTRITSGSTATNRTRSTTYTYDDYGLADTVEDSGDKAITGDEKCTRTWYARNTDKGLTDLVSRTRTVAKTCATADSTLDLPDDSTRSGDIISDTATVYDDTTATTWSADQKPTKGDAVWTGRAKSYASGTPSWQKTATTSYDSLGRPLLVKDTDGKKVTDTTYTPAASGPLTSSTVANIKGHTATTDVDFATGNPVKAKDANDKITETEYDSLGRVTGIWLPNRSKVLKKSANYVFGYKVQSADMSWVSTGTLKGDGSGYNTSYMYYDSLLRPRQTQTPTPIGGRIVGLTLYDDRGLAISSQGDIWDKESAPAGDDAVQTEGSQAPVQTDTTYDGAGRATKTVTQHHGVTRWTTNTTYTGDKVAASTQAGGQATAVITNALGQTVERREYAGPKPEGTDYTTTTYTYTPAGQNKTVTGPDDAKWSYGYDLFGRQTTSTDPDKGTTNTWYDNLDRIDYSVDAENKKLLYGYDELSRKTGLWQTDKTAANKLAAWEFDTLAKGQQDSATRYVGGSAGKAYTQKVDSYDSLYQVTGSQLALPDDDELVKAGVPKTLSFSTSYRLDGTPSQQTEPAVAGLASEAVEYTYNATGQQLTSQGTTGYLQGAVLSPQGDLTQLSLGMQGGNAAKKAYLNYEYEKGTRRLARSFVTDDVHGYMPQELAFSQDEAGNVTSIFDGSTQGGTIKPDYQCFTYDGHRRLSEAWTPKTADCAATGRTTANIDGAAPYWTSYTYKKSGQRDTETQHAATSDTKTSYGYGTDKGQPHTLTRTETGAKTNTYTYYNTGDTKTRPGPTGQQSLDWNSEGKLAKLTEGAAETGYLYDASGELLIRRAKGDGDSILYLGGTEVRLTAKGTTKTLSGSRYYTANGQTIAVRTATSGVSGTKLSFLATDHHGTSSLALDAGTYAITKRYTSPFGTPRGTKATNWPDDKAFLGKPADTGTGLTHIGAREYDPATGQFISVDPLLSLDQHQSLNGYAYANNTPITSSDPTGLRGTCETEWDPSPCSKDDPNGDGNPDHGRPKPHQPYNSFSGGTAQADSASRIYQNGPSLGYGPNVDEYIQANQDHNAPSSPDIYDYKFWANAARDTARYFKENLGQSDECAKQAPLRCDVRSEGTVDVGGSLLAKSAAKTVFGRILEKIRPTQKAYPGTKLPKSFTIETTHGRSVWVHPNATKHIEEELRRAGRFKDMLTEDYLVGLYRSIDAATVNGIQYGHKAISHGWELIIVRPKGGQAGADPVLKHARIVME
ncbi:RHS repeat-associated core domain-containing protein [Streptomyces sp. NBC_01304]|uniref:RHS repeat-associated core domain-containing protein n=1 Tax=Streptomyces sp. NBC_01304 TaxID=2903818 RepID=UPI002E14A204|nr:RHS repeat-associated core domain-containing protein [Streptomyces sp. NBC_01304]WSJ90876.1 RHS repeat-associated core domain-containing protein [Streptomyces sp. NBC_01304]